MKTFSGPLPPKLLDRTSARNYLLTNLLVLPGLGSWLAGKRFVGVLQAVLALTGFGLTGFWLVSFLGACIQTETFPSGGGPQFRLGLIGVALCLAGWFWAIATSLRILRATHTTSA
jgi:hypothetical protein